MIEENQKIGDRLRLKNSDGGWIVLLLLLFKWGLRNRMIRFGKKETWGYMGGGMKDKNARVA